jgi:hypothetical protein
VGTDSGGSYATSPRSWPPFHGLPRRDGPFQVSVSAVLRAAGRLLQSLRVNQHGGQHAGTSIHEMLRQPPTANSLKLKLQLHGKCQHHIPWPPLTMPELLVFLSNPPRQCECPVTLGDQLGNGDGPGGHIINVGMHI